MSPSTSSGRRKLVIIDGNAIMHRAFHALPPLTTRAGEPINAVYGLVSMLLRIIDDLKPTHLTVCFDEKEPTFRKKEYVHYQAKRPVMDEGLSGQFPKAKKTLEAMGIPIYSKSGYEADDVIGTLATRSIHPTGAPQAQRHPKGVTPSESLKIDGVVIITGDRDILQLVNDKVKVYMPAKGLSDGRMMGREEVIEKMGVAPELIPDYKALAGDSSDNYPGVPGIGPKGATELLGEFRDIGGVYKNLDKIKTSLREKLEKGKESCELSHRLATIKTDVPVEFDIDSMSKWSVANPKVLNLFAEFGFRTLTTRIKQFGKVLDNEKQLSLL